MAFRPGADPGEIALGVAMDRSAVSRLTTGLRTADLVQRSTPPIDNENTRCALSAAGPQAVRSVWQ